MTNLEGYDDQDDLEDDVQSQQFWDFFEECKGFILKIKEGYYYFLPPGDDKPPKMH